MYDTGDKLIAILLSLMILAQACIIRKRVGTFLFPAALFSLAWFFYTFVPLVLLFPVPINPVPIGYIFLCSIMFNLGAAPFDWQAAFIKNATRDVQSVGVVKSSFIRLCLYFSFCSAIMLSTLFIVQNGVELKALISNLTATTAQYAVVRGQGHQRYGLVGVFAYLFTNITPVFGALVFDAGESLKKKGLHIILSFGPAVYCMLTQSSKIVMLTSVLLFIASQFFVKVYSAKLGLFKISLVFKSIAAGLIMIPLVSYSLLARGGSVSFDSFKDTVGRIVFGLNSYLLGQVYAFSDFFCCYLGMQCTQSYKSDYNSLGYYTFKAIFDSFGGKKVFPPGYYDEAYACYPFVVTNIYTAFRSLICDFGWAGTLLMFLLAGYVVHYFFHRLLTNDRPWFSCVVFVVSTVAIFMSYLFSIFTSRYISFVGTVLFLVLLVNDRYGNRLMRQKPPKVV